jgi:hypothetical protein
VGPRTGLDDTEKRKFLTLSGLGTPTPRSSSPWPVAVPAFASTVLSLTDLQLILHLLFAVILKPEKNKFFNCFSGLSTSASDGQGRGVTPVYLRCSQGHLEWVYPRGALRVLVRLGTSGRDFRGCVKVGSNFGGARIFLEAPRSLVPLFSVEDGAPVQLVRCFHSRGGQAALYVEAATSKTDFTKEVASLTYDLEPLPRGAAAYDPSEGRY